MRPTLHEMTTSEKPVGLVVDSLMQLVDCANPCDPGPGSAGSLSASVRALQRRGVSFIVIRDDYRMADGAGSMPRIDPFITAAALSRQPGLDIAFVIETDVSLFEPFHMAKNLASLDHALAGRLGWAPRFSADPESFSALSLAGAPDPDPAGYLAEYCDLVRELWDTWEPDAIVRDVAEGRYLDPDRVRILNYQSERFSVRGPLLVPRSPQGHVPTFGCVEDVDVATEDARLPDLILTPTLRPELPRRQVRLLEPDAASEGALDGFAAGAIVLGDRGPDDVDEAFGRLSGSGLGGRTLRELFALGEPSGPRAFTIAERSLG